MAILLIFKVLIVDIKYDLVQTILNTELSNQDIKIQMLYLNKLKEISLVNKKIVQKFILSLILSLLINLDKIKKDLFILRIFNY